MPNNLDKVAERITTNENLWDRSAKLNWFEVFPHFYFNKVKIDTDVIQRGLK